VKTLLLDVNLLIALAWPNHVDHCKAKKWFSRTGRFSWATCPITQNGFIRISSNPNIIDNAVPAVEAIALLTKFTQSTGHHFWVDSVSAEAYKKLPAHMLQGHRQITDAYLLLLTCEYNGRLATLDKRLANSVSGTEFKDTILYIG
jgi:uncharacterized protein